MTIFCEDESEAEVDGKKEITYEYYDGLERMVQESQGSRVPGVMGPRVLDYFWAPGWFPMYSFRHVIKARLIFIGGSDVNLLIIWLGGIY